MKPRDTLIESLWIVAAILFVLSALLSAWENKAKGDIPGIFLARTPSPSYPSPSWLSPLDFPKGMVKYERERYTQSIYVLSNRDVIEKVPVRSLEAKWHVSGGMLDVPNARSDKYRLVPGKVKFWVQSLSVDNSLGYKQDNRALSRLYPDGTRFDDVLSYNGVVFEHRSRRKEKGKWVSEVLYENHLARPKGYTGLSSTCGSCHNKAGTGKYDSGLVPGGDTILSDPMDWHVAGSLLRVR